MKNINFSFPQGKFRKNDLFLKLKYKKYKRKVYEKVSFLVLSGIITLTLSGCWNSDGVSGKVARSFKEACQDTTTKYDWLVADVKYKLVRLDKNDIHKEEYVVYDKNDEVYDIGGMARQDLTNYAQLALTNDNNFAYAKIKIRGPIKCMEAKDTFDKAPESVKPMKRYVFFTSTQTNVERK